MKTWRYYVLLALTLCQLFTSIHYIRRFSKKYESCYELIQQIHLHDLEERKWYLEQVNQNLRGLAEQIANHNLTQ